MSKLATVAAAAAAMMLGQTRAVRVDFICGAGCVSVDSVDVATALRAGLTQSRLGRRGGGAIVRTRVEVASSRSGPIATAPVPDLPLAVTGRISLEGGQVRVVAEFFEGQRVVTRDSILVTRDDVPAQVKRLGERLGSALSDR